jgi:hypothetical protein
MPITKASEAFASLLKFHLQKAGVSGNALARATGADSSLVSRVLTAERYPPDNLEKWADFLNLLGPDRELFLESGYLCKSPPFIVSLVERLKKQVAQHQATPKG